MTEFSTLWNELSELEAVRSCYASLPEAAPDDYRKMASLLAAGGLLPTEVEGASGRSSRKAKLLGVGGGQGAGKSTLSQLIAAALEYRGYRVCVLSLDDFYLTQSERMALGRDVHPLLTTRGPPGTHDFSRLSALIEALRFQNWGETGMDAKAQRTPATVPIFDKGMDDRVGERVVDAPVDWIVLEGWCVGARPLDRARLKAPINGLEAERDPDGVWRAYLADCLERVYAPFWERLDATLFLRVPSLEAVRRWRLGQERARPVSRRLNAAAVARFVEHYERITRSMWGQAPLPGQLTVSLGEAHEVLEVSIDGTSA